MGKEKDTRRITDEYDSNDPFYSEENIKHLKKIIAEYENGKTQVDEHDLIEDRKMVLMKKIKKVESVIAELPEEWVDVVEDHLDYIICKCTGEIE